MKHIIIVSIFIFASGLSLGQSKSANNYIIFFDESNSARYYKMGSRSYVDYFLFEKVKFDDIEYYARIRTYSWGDSDTAYFREDDKFYYSYHPKRNAESVVLPKMVTLGQQWLEADSSWSYEIIGVSNKLDTPSKKFKDCIVIECIQLTNRDKEKSKEYHMYYAKGIGLVGSVNNEKLTSYLSEVKKKAKDGDQIGN